MAATTLTQATEEEILKIFKVVASKTIASVDSLVKSTQPKLNVLIADTIDAFRSSPQRVDKVMSLLIARMKDLGMSVDELTKGMDKIPEGMQSLQDALRAKEEKRIEVEKQVQDLRAAGIAAEIEEGQLQLITKNEMIAREEKWAETAKYIATENNRLQKETNKIEDLTFDKRIEKENKIIGERQDLVLIEEEMARQKKQSLGEPGDNVRGGGGAGQPMLDPRGMFAPIVDQFMGIKDSIIGPFLEIGGIAKRVGVSFMNFGKSMMTPIKSLKRFGVSLMLALVPMLPWALLLIVLVAVVAMVIFKWKAIAKAVGEWWTGFKATLSDWWESVKNIAIAIKDWIMNIPTMLGEAIESAVEFIGGIGTKIWDALGEALEAAKNFIMDGFKNLMNGIISLINKIPGVNIPLLKTSDQLAAAKVSEEDTTEGKKFMQNQWNEVPTGVKDSLKVNDADRKDFVEGKFKEQVAPDGAKAVIVQDNKTINNSQSNAETSMVAKADKNPEPASRYNDLGEFI